MRSQEAPNRAVYSSGCQTRTIVRHTQGPESTLVLTKELHHRPVIPVSHLHTTIQGGGKGVMGLRLEHHGGNVIVMGVNGTVTITKVGDSEPQRLVHPSRGDEGVIGGKGNRRR